MTEFADLWNEQPALLRERGRAYQRQGRVRILEANSARVRARVRGTELYSVSLTSGPKAWHATCSCPAFSERGQCKHVCAVLVELSASEGVPIASTEEGLGRRATQGEPGFQGEFEDELEDFDEDEYDVSPIRLPLPRSLPRTRQEAQLRRVEQQLREIIARKQGDRAEWSRVRELIHALGVDTPPARTGRRAVKCRYVLHPIDQEAEVVGFDIEQSRATARGTVADYRIVRRALHDVDLDELDALVLELVGGHTGGEFPAHLAPAPFDELVLRPGLQSLLLPRLALARRLFLANKESAAMRPLELDEDEPWSFRLDVKAKKHGFELEGSLARGAERIPLSEVTCALKSGFAIARGRLLCVEWHNAAHWAAHMCGERPVRAPRAEAADLARLLGRAPPNLPISAEGLIHAVKGPPRPVLTLAPPRNAAAALQARLDFDYEGVRARRLGPSVTVKGDLVIRIERDDAFERAAEGQFTECGGTLLPPGTDADGTFEQKKLGALVRGLVERGWLVEGEHLELRSVGTIDIGVSSGVDWFDVSVAADFGGVSPELPALLEALASKKALVQLSDGSFGILPEAWSARWAALGALGSVHDGIVRVKRSRAFLLDILLDERTAERGDAPFQELRARLARARNPKPLAAPSGFRGELRHYQEAGLGWLAYLGEIGFGGCLADDMGLGKTVQLLALIERRREGARGPTLVVAPNTLIFNWQNEAARFTPAIDVHVHHGTARSKSKARIEDAGLVLTTYGTLRQDAHFLSKVHFDLVVLDEAQAIKNPRSQSAKAARLLDAEQRVALTGTPIENRVEDVLSIFEFLNPGLLEGSRALRHLLEGSNDVESARLASRALGPFLLRRTKEEVLTELPAKSEQIVSCELGGPQRREYNALRDHFRAKVLGLIDEVGLKKAGMNVLEALLRLRQAACHLALVDPSHAHTKSAKLETLLEMLAELRASGHKALVFSQFTSFLAHVKSALDAQSVSYAYLDGQTTARAGIVERFQSDPTQSVFLISLKAGGVGLNLTAADYVFLLDPWWNPAVERQAIDRTHRIGQTRSVTAYRLVARDTVEEKVLLLQDQKRALAEALFEGSNASLRGLTRADLEAILS